MCGHKDGGHPYRCMKAAIGINLGRCEQQCTDHDFCVGFSFNDLKKSCIFYPAQDSCPSDWNLNTGNVASNENDLVEGALPGYNCMAKQGVSLIKPFPTVQVKRN